MSVSVQDDCMQPGDEVHSRPDRQGWEAGSQEKEEGGGGGGKEEVGQRQQALITSLPAQREPQDGDPEEAGDSRQGAAARGPGMEGHNSKKSRVESVSIEILLLLSLLCYTLSIKIGTWKILKLQNCTYTAQSLKMIMKKWHWKQLFKNIIEQKRQNLALAH